MELHILEHSLKVASIAKEGIQICTHGLIKLAFLRSKTSCFLSHTDAPSDEGLCKRPSIHRVSDAPLLCLRKQSV
uniref:CASTOR1 N-terminal domain-containing protein n=1 Tax=Cyprinus carpio TaxID=7962 RepID=A0A8C2JQS2_CYPCA